jgi:Protein of unknown function (DUF455)
MWYRRLRSRLHGQARLRELGSEYGALPAHEGLWESAAATAHSLPARLAIESCVHEARGLDVLPQTISRCIRAANGSRGSACDRHHMRCSRPAITMSHCRSGTASPASSMQWLSQSQLPRCADARSLLCRFRNGGDKATATLLEDVIYPVSAALRSLTIMQYPSCRYRALCLLPYSFAVTSQEEISHCAAGTRWLTYLFDQAKGHNAANASECDALAPQMYPDVHSWFHALVRQHFKGDLKVCDHLPIYQMRKELPCMSTRSMSGVC